MKAFGLTAAWGIPLMACVLFSLIGCRPDNGVAGGSTSEGEAKIAGLAIYPDGRPVTGARVRLRTESFAADSLRLRADIAAGQAADGVTDAQGRFRLAGIAAGKYCVEINDGAGSAALVSPTLTKQDLGNEVSLPKAVLQATGSIEGGVEYSGGQGAKGIVQVLGLQREAILDTATGAFTFTDIPTGHFQVVSPAPDSVGLPVAFAPVEVKPKETASVGSLERQEDLGHWKHSRKITLNPGIALAGGTTKVLKNVPFLVRLDAGVFPFAEARGQGQDIRFTQADGKPMKFGFRGWDSAGAKAEIWVKRDLQAGAAPQTFLMYWGNAVALSRSRGYNVFLTNDGWRAVWHLTHPMLPSGIMVLDSSSNLNIGRAVAPMPWADSGGLSAFGALRMDTANPAVFSTKPYANLDSFTLSLWFKTTSGMGGRLCGMGDSRNSESLLQDRQIWMGDDGKVYFGVAPGLDTAAPGVRRAIASPSVYNDARWHQVTAVLSPAEGMVLYLDGAPVASDPATTHAGNYLGYWRLGNDLMTGWTPLPSTPAWSGLLQEFWVLHRPMDAEWIRVSYANTRPESALVEVPPN